MGPGHHHHHSHGHSHPEVKGMNLLITIFLNILITVSQVIGGIISGSLALISDALHSFSDVLSLIVSYIANVLSKKETSPNKTFGYKRAEIIAAFVNSATLIIVAIIVIKEAIERLITPEATEFDLVIWLSLLGIAANGSSVLLPKKDYTRILMLFTPNTVQVRHIVQTIVKFKPVKNAHHVHVWQLNENEVHLGAHIDFDKDIKISQFDDILEKMEDELYHNHGINHVNIQPEFGKCDSKDIIVQD